MCSKYMTCCTNSTIGQFALRFDQCYFQSVAGSSHDPAHADVDLVSAATFKSADMVTSKVQG